jgi:cytochrome c oxidase cbb3-type subunit 4
MNAGTVAGIFTALSMLAFIGVVAWAMSSRRQRDFAEAERLPLHDEDAPR